MSSPVLTTAVSRSLQDKAKIHEDQELLAAIVESSEDAIIGESLDGIITSWNSGAAKMFGYANHEIVGKSVSVLHSPETAEELEGILDLIRQGKGKSHFESKRLDKNGTEIDVSISVSPIRDRDGQIVGAAKIFRDITDRRRSEKLTQAKEKLEIANRFAVSVAHEINNPLSALTNLLYLLKTEDLPERASQLLNMAERQLTRLTHLTTQALGFYHENGRPTDHLASQLMEQAIAIHQHRIETRAIAIEERYEDSISIICHGGEMKQVLVNLIGNAIDAMNNQGRLQLRVRHLLDHDRQPSAVRILVADTGCGIPKEILSHLYEPFQTTKGDTHTGLGLWMCQQIILRHRGILRIRSNQTYKNHATVVSITLPTSLAVSIE
jgi:PAS domain S-box-containing protein